jgi:transcriptional regulator with XRE-family HTH domain
MGNDRQHEDRTDTDADADSSQLTGREFARLQIADQIAKLRMWAGLSQAALADRIGTKQAGVARMERRNYQGYTVATLAKIAAATGARLEVRLDPPSRPARRRSPGHPEPNGR